MKIQVLIENTTQSEGLQAEHGLCCYVETKDHRLLVDTGASGLFAENAKNLGVDLSKVDTLILSHGHYDHGGGIRTFLAINQQARIYVQEQAFGNYFARHGESMDYIGLEKELGESPGFVFVQGERRLDQEFLLFSGVPHREFWPKSNYNLYEKRGQSYEQDEFYHEQNLVITEGRLQVLICGCAHNGIVNILKKSRELTGRWPDAVIGGFHLMNPSKKEEADRELVEGTAEFLKGLQTSSGPTRYYTGHCTGLPALALLKEILGERVEGLSCGKTIELS